MKKIFYIACVAVLCLTSCHKSLWAEIDDLKNEYTDLATRVAKLEELCKEINTNVSAIQTIINVQQTGDYITGITPVIKDGKTIGYTITFAKHEAITIYNGEDGRDGANGINGTDGYTPVIGVAQDTDGKYYWTLDGHWMTDSANNKIPVTGRDGRDGIDGANGTNGQDGQDGITPQLKIEAEYWYVSYDNGATWTQLGKATGNDGQNGTDGTNGQDGDSMFQSVTYDSTSMTFVLSDGTSITIPRGTSINQSGDGYVISGMSQGHCYVDLGLPSGTKWATCNIGSDFPEGSGYYFSYGETDRKATYTSTNYTPITSLSDIQLTAGDAVTANWGTFWATPNTEQWNELMSWARWTTKTKNGIRGIKVTGVNGNSMFIPICGLCLESGISYANIYFVYMSSIQSESRVDCIRLNMGYSYTWPGDDNPISCTIDNYGDINSSTRIRYYKYYGYPIRAVLLNNTNL